MKGFTIQDCFGAGCNRSFEDLFATSLSGLSVQLPLLTLECFAAAFYLVP